jgi:hypothetical protein
MPELLALKNAALPVGVDGGVISGCNGLRLGRNGPLRAGDHRSSPDARGASAPAPLSPDGSHSHEGSLRGRFGRRGSCVPGERRLPGCVGEAHVHLAWQRMRIAARLSESSPVHSHLFPYRPSFAADSSAFRSTTRPP